MMSTAKLHRYIGLLFALLLLTGFISTGEKRDPQLAPLDHTVIGYLTTDKEKLRYEFSFMGQYISCELLNSTSKKQKNCASEMGWPTQAYLERLPQLTRTYPEMEDLSLDPVQNVGAILALYARYLQDEELPVLKAKILANHALLFLCFLFAVFKREAIGRFICNPFSHLWSILKTVTKRLSGTAKNLHERV